MTSNDGLVQGKYILGSNTHVGDPRRKYEDHVFVGEIIRPGADPLIVGIVADGVGSADAGLRAAILATETVIGSLEISTGNDIPVILENAIKSANSAVFSWNQQNNLDGLTTLVVAIIDKMSCYVGNVGDSRAYWAQAKGNKLIKLTRDHSYYNIYGGNPHSEDAGVLVNAIGRKDEVYIDLGFYLDGDNSDQDKALRLGTSGLPLKEGDAVVLCSDGVTNIDIYGHKFVTNEEIIHALQSEYKSNSAARKITGFALSRRPDDNISVVTIQYLTPKEKGLSSATNPSMMTAPLVFILVLALILWATSSVAIKFATLLNPPTPTASFTPSIVPTDTLAKITQASGFSTKQVPTVTLTAQIASRTPSPVLATPTTPKLPTRTPIVKITDTEEPTSKPDPTQTLQAAFEEIDRQFNNLTAGNIAFNKPERMMVGDVTVIELILSPSLSQSALATQLVDQGGFVTSTADAKLLISPSGNTVKVETGQIEITPRIKAVLLPQDSEAFIVEDMHDDPEQVVSTVETTTWRWSVAAKKQGSQTLELVIYQLVKYDGKEFWHEVETYKADIFVEVTTADQGESILSIISSIGAVVTVIAAILGILKWFEDRKKKPGVMKVEIVEKKIPPKRKK